MGTSLGFQTKLSVLTIAIVLVTVLCLSISQIFMANKDALRQGRDGLARISATLAESVALQNTLMQKKLRIDRDIMKTQFELGGFPVPEVLMDAEMDIVDQAGGAAEKSVLPAIGECHNCAASVPPGALFCDTDCRDDHERYIAARRREGLHK